MIRTLVRMLDLPDEAGQGEGKKRHRDPVMKSHALALPDQAARFAG